MNNDTTYRRGRQGPITVEESLINHLSLPPQLPQFEEFGLETIERALLARIQHSARCMRDLPASPSRNAWQSVCRAIYAWQNVTEYGRLDKTVLETELRNLDISDFLVLYIREQNAGISIYRSSE